MKYNIHKVKDLHRVPASAGKGDGLILHVGFNWPGAKLVFVYAAAHVLMWWRSMARRIA